MAALEFTGERFLPEVRGEIWLEHWHRYHFAALVTRDARVLDVASGEGYGTALLAAAAREVIGVDASADAIAHATSTYGNLDNARFVAGDCARLPLPDAAFDVVVSFETIEHIRAQAEFLAETRRVLAPGGLLLLSSPNKAEYTDRRGYANPYHVAELYRDELAALLGRFYPHTAWYGQGIGFCSTILAEDPERTAGELVGRQAGVPADPGRSVQPLYYIVACAATPAALRRVVHGYSVLGDPDDAIYRDYRDTYRKFVAASEAVGTYREREAALERDRAEVRTSGVRDIAFIQERLAAAEAQRDAALSEAAALRAEAERLRAESESLKTLASEFGGNAHAAQQAALRLTAALDDAHRRYAAGVREIDAHKARLEAQAAELVRREKWLWRLRPPGRR